MVARSASSLHPPSPTYHNYLNNLVSAANIGCVSVEYRRAPEHLLPAVYEDSWSALKWVATHSDGAGPDEWLNAFTDPKRVFLAGDSAEGNITHYVALRFGTADESSGIVIEGAMLVHPYFWGNELLDGEKKEKGLEVAVWKAVCPGTNGCDDPWINTVKDPDLGRLGCGRAAVFVAENDVLCPCGVYYAELLRGREGRGGEYEVRGACVSPVKSW